MTIPPIAQQALDRARQGDLAGALDAAREAVAEHPDDYGLRLFIGSLHLRRMELEEALVHVGKAAALAPSDPIARVELVRILVALGRLDDAQQQLGDLRLRGLEPLRLQAMIEARRGNHGPAAQLFRQIVNTDPRDHESWANLGASLIAMGQPELAADALERAAQLRPDILRFREKWTEAQVAAGRGEDALAAARQVAKENPKDPAAQLVPARLEDLLGRPEKALQLLKWLLDDHPLYPPALISLAGLLERQNLIEDFSAAIERIEKVSPEALELPLLRARLAYRRGDLDEALRLANAAPEVLDRGARAELIGRIQERLGNSAQAFRAFEEMNEDTDLSREVIAHGSQALRNLIDDRAAITTKEWMRGWSAASDQTNAREPAFLIGFPRSGTTLLDSFLMGHPQISIAEELPMLTAVSEQMGDYRRLAELDPREIGALRNRYFEVASEHIPDVGDRLLIDKFPLGAIEAAVFHRLFPGGKIIFLQRHPCDVVLSCYFTRFQPTPMMINFYTLEDAAKLYDKVMSFWVQCLSTMPLDVYNLKYEKLIAEPEAEARNLLSFLGLDWNEAVLDYQKRAREPAFIRTASYAQVVEPLYDRSIGRWERYSDQLAPVLPMLMPWAERMGYGI